MMITYRAICAILVTSSLMAWDAIAQSNALVTVEYWTRHCGMPGMLGQTARVTAGTLELRQVNGNVQRLTLGPKPIPVTLTASGLLSATLVLETSKIRIVSGASSSKPVTLELKPAMSSGGNVTFAMYHKEDDHNGDIHALLQLERAAEFAEQANGAPLPLVNARVFDDPKTLPADITTQYDEPQAMNVVAVAGRDDRWEPTRLIHEYGHHVMHHVAPGGPAGADHVPNFSYPARPDLAWTEGFATAFAGLVTDPEWSGLLYDRCGPHFSFREKPARPHLAPNHARYAQYNETRVAAATYHLVKHLGGGVPGFKRLLDGMKSYKRNGKPAQTARDLRDLAVDNFETSAADHAAIDEIFFMEGMSWERLFHLALIQEDDRRVSAASDEFVLSLTGPGGFECRTSSDIERVPMVRLDGDRGRAEGKKVADGGLPFISANDDCYLVSGDGLVGTKSGQPHTQGIDHVEIPFPYLRGLAHWDAPYKVIANYVCDFDQRMGTRGQFHCPPTARILLKVGNSWLNFHEPKFIEGIELTLVRGVDTQIVTFKANGECTIIGGIDCGF